jgi:N-acetylglucosamine-6-phosphate deacetylase
MKVIRGCSVFTGNNISISIDGGLIKEVKNLDSSEELPFISPGFMDTQVNGFRGLDYSSENLKLEDVVVMAEMLAASGTTCHFPTIVTSSRDITTKNLKIINSALLKYPELNVAIGGIHIEGPYISSEDGARGAHNLKFVRNPDYEEFSEWQNVSGGRIRQLTLAPERPGAINFIKRVSSDGVIVSIGHTAASPEIIKTAIHAGAGMSTHLGNGSHRMIPRLKNYIWEQLASDNLHASIITDGFHLPFSVVKVILRAKTLDRVILVSDVAVLGGMKKGIYKWGDIDVEVYNDGHLGLAGTEYLAGAGHLFDHSLAWLMNETNLSPGKAVSLCTMNPCRLFFPEESVPGLNAGDPADITLFNWKKGNQKLTILETWRTGERVYS